MARLTIAFLLVIFAFCGAEDKLPDSKENSLEPSSKKDSVEDERAYFDINPRKILNWTRSDLYKELQDIINERKESEQKLIDDVAVRGDPVREYRIGLREMNLFMRKHHSEMRIRVGHNLYPLIIALDTDHDKKLSGIGSEYILYLQNGTIMTMKPTPMEYETNKNLAHIALGIFSIISPYFKNPTATHWHGALREYQNIIQSNIKALEDSGLNNTFSPLCDENLTAEDQKWMLSAANEYIKGCFKNKSVDIKGYQRFTKSFRPYMQKALKCAAQMQVKSGLAGMEKWKEQLGPKLWRDTYVMIPVIWPVARSTPRQLIFDKLMDPDRKLTHIFKAQGVTTIADTRELLGRIVADRSMAHFVFGSSRDAHDIDTNLALSTRRDIAATYGYETLQDYFRKDEDIAKNIAFYSKTILANDLRYDDEGPPAY